MLCQLEFYYNFYLNNIDNYLNYLYLINLDNLIIFFIKLVYYILFKSKLSLVSMTVNISYS